MPSYHGSTPPEELLSALIRLGYDGLIPVYCCRPF
jgi:hypothetical protein